MRTIPSNVDPYPARPRFPIVHMAGHIPTTLFAPGSCTEASNIPPVKQNLFLRVIVDSISKRHINDHSYFIYQEETRPKKNADETSFFRHGEIVSPPW